MNNEVMIGMTTEMNFFIGKVDSTLDVMKDVFLLQHQVAQQGGGNTVVHFGMIDPFQPYSDAGNKPVPELPMDWFVATKKPRRDIENKYLETVSGITIMPAGAMPKGNGKKVVQAHRGETINFADLKPKK